MLANYFDDRPLVPGLEFPRFESWSRDIWRRYFQSLGLGLGVELQSLGLKDYFSVHS